MDEIEDSDTISPTNDSMMANKFVVSLNTICLDVSKPVQLIIKYDYSIFSTKPCTTGYPFQISPSKSEDFKIPTEGYKEYEFIMKKSEMKMALDLTPLVLNIFDKKEQLGKASADLSKILSPEAENMPYGLRYRRDYPIIGVGGNIIGSINCTFVLEREECVQCKSCDDHFKPSVILKHVKGNKDCRPYFSKKDLEHLQKQSSDRKKKMRNIRNWKKYDPVKRAKLHAKYYNPNEAAKHRRYLKVQKKQQKRKLKERNHRILIEAKKSMEKEASEKNLDAYADKKTYFKQAKQILSWEEVSIPDDIESNIESLKQNILVLRSRLKKKIKKTSTYVDGLNHKLITPKSSMEIKEIWAKMKGKIDRDWQKLGVEMDKEFKNAAQQLGAPDETINYKFGPLNIYLYTMKP